MIDGILLTVFGCLFATIVIETLFALAMRVRGRDIWIVVLGQIVTNPIVVLVSNLAISNFDASVSMRTNTFLLVAGVMEIFAIFTEGAMYKYFFTNYSRINPYVLSIILNILSLVIGFLLLVVILGIPRF